MLFGFWFQTKKKNYAQTKNLTIKASKSKYWEYCWSNHSFWFNNTEQQQQNNTNNGDLYQVLLIKNQMGVCIKFYSSRIIWGMYKVFLKNQMGVCTKFYSSRSKWGSMLSFTPQESDGGMYQVLLIKNQMGVCIKFYSSRIKWVMYQVLLLMNQMGICTKFYS